MRASIRVSGLLAFSLFLVPSIFAQTNPPPSDPHELVVHQPRTLSSPAERSAAIDLLEHARQDLNMHTFGAYQLKSVVPNEWGDAERGQWNDGGAVERAGMAMDGAGAGRGCGPHGRRRARVRRESQRASSAEDSANSRGVTLANLPKCRSPERDSIGKRAAERQTGNVPAAEFGCAG